MSDREAHRFDHLSDGHLADKAAYGDSGAFVALADRFHEEVWTVAALAAVDEGTATRATARAFTRTLAGVAAGISDPDACVERALVAAAFELAVSARIDDEDLADRIPAALLAEEPATRVALWLTARGWSEGDALAAVAHDAGSASSLVAAPAARTALAALDLDTPDGLATATADAWHEWQGIGLTIPERHPLTAVLSRLDVPLGRMGTALGRAGSRTTRRRRARAVAPVAAATPPPADLLPVGADREAEAVVGDLGRDFVPFDLAAASDASDASGAFLGPRDEDLTLPERRHRRGPRPRHLVTAGSTPTRTRVLAALAAGILTASAMGSLLTSAPTDSPGTRGDEIAAGATGANGTGEGALLDDGDLIPAANVTDADGTAAAESAGGSTAAPTVSSDVPRDAATRSSSPSGGGSNGTPAGGGPAAGGAPAGSGGSSGGGGGIGGGSSPTPGTSPAAPPTTQPPPTTAPPSPPTTTPPPPTTPPPTTQPPGPVCGLLPVLCPGGGLLP
ncbi:MAG TPA: hypothetical protein VF228_17880 [Iamia sp.]